MATDNPLGLEPSELAALTRAKAAAAAAKTAAAKPKSLAQQLADVVSQTNDLVSGVKASDVQAQQNVREAAVAVDTAKVNLATQKVQNTQIAKDTGQAIDKTSGMIVPAGTANSTSYAAAANDAGGVVSSVLGQLDATQLDAYALLEDAFNQYGLSDLIPTIKGYMQQNIGPQQASLMLKQTDVYKTRFAGNYGASGRVAQGLNALTESEYLALENKYNETLTSYGLGDYFGTTAKAKQAGMANIIAGDISAPEFQSRVQLAEDNVVNADPQVLKTLKDFYPAITGTDLLKYYLDPAQNLAALTLKTTSAGIGAAAVNQGLNANAERAMLLAQTGVTAAGAQKGYVTIGEEVPVAAKLGNIYNASGIQYDQTAAEAEQFGLAGAASAQRKRQQLIDLEQGSFNARSGLNTTVNPLGKGLQGSF